MLQNVITTKERLFMSKNVTSYIVIITSVTNCLQKIKTHVKHVFMIEFVGRYVVFYKFMKSFEYTST